ncbi:MAG: hypothetical protein LBV31_02905, partial [Prevotellaceae bacterium]|nr:hypothetical protein [Prevotellaceae bacterium]
MKITKLGAILLLAISLFACQHHNVDNEIKNSIVAQLGQYPELRLQDIYKNFYQDCFGTGHAIADT